MMKLQTRLVSLAPVALLCSNALALNVDYVGEVEESTGGFAALVPPGTAVGGPIVYDDAAVAGGLAGPADITRIDVNVGGFCFSTGADTSGCPLGGTLVPITSIDAAAVTFAAGRPTGGTMAVTAFSDTFQISIPIAFDLTAGTFFADGGGIGTATGTFGPPPGEFIYKGGVTAATGALETLVPVGTPVAGPMVADSGAVAVGLAGPDDILSMDINVGGFCFSTGPDGTGCPLQPNAYVPITSIDAAALTFTGGAPTGGTLSITTFSPTFMVAIPIDFDLTAGTFSADGGDLGTVSGNGVLTIPVDTDGDGVLDNFDNCIEVANADQYDSNGDDIGSLCDADITGAGGVEDCSVNFLDLQAVKAAFFSNPASPSWNPDADFDNSGSINFTDLQIVKAQFFGPPGPSAFGCN